MNVPDDAPLPPTPEQMEADMQRFLQEHGWHPCFNYQAHGFPNHVDVHTHGLEENFGHRDLQLCYRVPPSMAVDIFATVVHEIEQGETFRDGDTSTEILAGLTVEFIAVRSGNRKLLRVCLPDRQNRLRNGDNAEQYSLTTDEPH